MNLIKKIGIRCLSPAFRNFSVSSTSHKEYKCRLLVIGGGTGGCTVAAKFARSLVKDSVIVLEPSWEHYYQPLYTLVGAGVTTLGACRRLEQSVLPAGVHWVRDAATRVDPDQCKVTTASGHVIHYEYVVIAVGVQNQYHKVPGLLEALNDKDSMVSTIYAPEYCEKTWADLQRFRGGTAIFTYPDTLIKCPGAPQKIVYLADSYFRRVKVRSSATLVYNTSLPVIFGVKKYADELLKVVGRKDIRVNYTTVLKEVRPERMEAVFYEKRTPDRPRTMQYSLLHVTPPMGPPQFLAAEPRLSDPAGYLDVDKYTLQHTKYPNVYGIGDCINTPNSKTAAAIAKQCYVLEANLSSTMLAKGPSERYNGYGACPLVTSYGTCILAEFLYDGVVRETFPFNQAKESKIAYYMKRDLFPFLYWNFMLKGYYHGPEFVRRIVNPFGN